METNRAWAEIDLTAIAHNTREIRKITEKKTKIMVMVKADGYGHGAAEIAKTVVKNGGDCVGVACAAEACELRTKGFSGPIVIVGYTPYRDIEKAVLTNATLAVCSYESAKAIDAEAKKQGKRASVHIKIDTGMTRLGLDLSTASLDEAEKICGLKNIWTEGIFSHLACADENDPGPSLLQFEKFMGFVGKLEKRGVYIPVKHICNSAGVIRFPKMHLDMVRPGLCIYGVLPYDEPNIKLKEAMSIKCKVARVAKVPCGTCVSYGGVFEVGDNRNIATLLIGYGDGIRRSMSEGGRVLIGGKYANIVGRVCMDMLMADVTNIPANLEDEAVIMGRQGNVFISACEIADICGTISYEIFCNMSKRLKRVYKKERN